MITGMFCYRLRPGIDLGEYQAETFRMYERVTGNPDFGFVDLRSYEGQNGESVLIATFETMEGLEAWRNDPEHVVVQERGRTEWFESYWLAAVTPHVTYDRQNGRQVLGPPAVAPTPQ